MIIYLGGETKQASIIIMSWIPAQVSPSSWSHAFTSTDLPWLDSTDLRGFHKRQLCIQHAAENILKILSLSCLTGKIKTRTASGDAGCHLDLHGWWLWSEKDPRDLSQYQRKPCDHKEKKYIHCIILSKISLASLARLTLKSHWSLLIYWSRHRLQTKSLWFLIHQYLGLKSRSSQHKTRMTTSLNQGKREEIQECYRHKLKVKPVYLTAPPEILDPWLGIWFDIRCLGKKAWSRDDDKPRRGGWKGDSGSYVWTSTYLSWPYTFERHLCSGLHQKRRQEVCSRDSKLSSNALRQPRKYLIQANDDMPWSGSINNLPNLDSGGDCFICKSNYRAAAILNSSFHPLVHSQETACWQLGHVYGTKDFGCWQFVDSGWVISMGYLLVQFGEHPEVFYKWGVDARERSGWRI